MNEILNQKFGVEVEMYDITRAQAAVVVKKTLEAWTHETYAIEGPGDHLDERRIHRAGCWLLRLGFIGDEFATARRVLTYRLPGDTAWRNGRPTQAAAEAIA